MKAFCACGLLALTTFKLFGSGTVLFENTAILVGGEQARFHDDQGVFLAGPTYMAQLYAGATSNQLVAVGTPVMFLTNSLSGYVRGGGVEIPFIPALTMAWVQIRAWEAEGGATFEEAALARRWTGISSILYLLTGGASPGVPAPPAPLQGLTYPRRPIIVRDPQPQQIRAGESATLEIVASGGVQLRYQWYQGESGNVSNPVTDATNAVFSASPATTTTYWVRASTSAGATDSAAGTVTVIPANAVYLNLRVEQHVPVVTVETPPAGQLQLQFSGNMNSPNWDTLTNVILTTNRVTIVDAGGSNALIRFYRGVILP